MKQYDRALAHLKKALELNPNDAELGLKQLDMALEHNPSNPSWYHWTRGTSFSILGRFDEALADLVRVSPSNASVIRWRAYAQTGFA